jgi:hypothetical protein
MKTKLIVALFAALTASAAAPAFASGYGPAPAYRPAVGAPASQRGQSLQTLAAESGDVNDGMQAAYGGGVTGQSEAGGRVVGISQRDTLFAHH